MPSSARLPRHSETARNNRNRKPNGNRTISTRRSDANRKVKQIDDPVDPMTMVSSRLIDAMDQLASMANDFFGDSRDVAAVDVSALTVESSDNSEVLHPGDIMICPTPSSDEEITQPSAFRNFRIAHESSAFVRPLPISASSTPSRASSDGGVVLRSSPMARMRNVEVRDASFLPPAPASPPRKNGEQAIQDKHAKWRRQIQLAKQKEAQHNKELEGQVVCGAVTRTQDATRKLFEQLLRSTNCVGELEDSISYVESFSVAESHNRSYSGESSDDEVDRPGGLQPLLCVDINHQTKLASPKRKGLQNVRKSDIEDDEQILSQLGSRDASENSSIVSVSDKNFIKVYIHEATEGIPMIWHNTNDSDPVNVLVFIEFGFLMEDGHYAAPRLAWYGAQEGDLCGAIDLFDIQSLEKATPLHLKQYPFAIPGNSSILRFHNKEGMDHVFESPNAHEALRFIHGLRWVVARMAFNMIIGNPVVTCELLDVPEGINESVIAMNDVTNQLIENALFHQSMTLA